MVKKDFNIQKYVTSKEIKSAREKLGLSQQDFARMLGVSKPTVARWETSKSEISGTIVFATYTILNSDVAEKCILPDMKYGLRLKYMYKNELCTLIDVDEVHEKIEVYNYTDNVMFKAFGKKKKPDYADYEDFLESRCFPKGRDKMKLVLKDLNLPFYDPMLIIEKTQGRMAEDDFWIDIQRK